jgi:sulfur carrier protein
VSGGEGRQVLVNGVARTVTAQTVQELLAELGRDRGGRGVAVALNGEVVPRAAWQEARIGPGDRVEIVGAVQGG